MRVSLMQPAGMFLLAALSTESCVHLSYIHRLEVKYGLKGIPVLLLRAMNGLIRLLVWFCMVGHGSRHPLGTSVALYTDYFYPFWFDVDVPN